MPQDSLTVLLPDINTDSIFSDEYVYDTVGTAERKAQAESFVAQEKHYDHLSDQIMVAETLLFVLILIRLGIKQHKADKLVDHTLEDAKPYASYDERGRRVYTYPAPVLPYLVYKGKELNLTDEKVIAILNKRFPYFTALSAGEQRRFLLRHKKFREKKIFKIHDDKGFIEMPVLITAAAIQLSFGLSEFELPQYTYINIYPQEFLRIADGIHFLEGNVSGNNIKISWKHFLQGYALPDNGENVGLHEMAHAYYSQNFLCDDDHDKCFRNGFTAFSHCGNAAFENEKITTSRFYSNYALRNFQEFWAESIERFFEKPQEMKIYYPEMYECICCTLNQRPC